jgi:hypothetical protein
MCKVTSNHEKLHLTHITVASQQRNLVPNITNSPKKIFCAISSLQPVSHHNELIHSKDPFLQVDILFLHSAVPINLEN